MINMCLFKHNLEHIIISIEGKKQMDKFQYSDKPKLKQTDFGQIQKQQQIISFDLGKVWRIEELRQSQNRFQKFLQELGSLKDSKLRLDISEQVSFGQRRCKKIDNQIKSCSIFSAIQSRVDKMIKTRRIKRNWGQQDLSILVWVVGKICELYQITTEQIGDSLWKLISSLIPGTTSNSCKFRWLNLKVNNLAAYRWTASQGQLLGDIIKKYTQKRNVIQDWKSISEQLYELNNDKDKCYRNAKQCKEHWCSFLSPQIKKGPWTKNQDYILLIFISKKGAKRWCQLVNKLKGRTQNAIKNRFNLLLAKERKLHKQKYLSQTQLIRELLLKSRYDRQDDLSECSLSSSEINFEQFVKTGDEKIYRSSQSAKGIEKNVGVCEEIHFQRLSFQDFAGPNLRYTDLHPGIMNSSFQFLSFDFKNRQKVFSVQKIEEKLHQNGSYRFKSFSDIFSQNYL